MGIVIDEMVAEVEPRRFAEESSAGPPPEGGAPQKDCDADLRRRLQRLHERRLRLAAD